MTIPEMAKRLGGAVAVARVPGTCGELVQGIIDGRHFHVTCPIDLYSTTRIAISPGAGRISAPADCPKARRAAEATLAHLGRRDVDAALAIESALPRGKGMASSTADVVGAIEATASALSARLSARQVAALALAIEPSDGLMVEGIALFDHRQGSLMESLGAPPPMGILVLDFGGEVDTLAFNAVDRMPQLAAREAQWRTALSLVREGLRRSDAALIARGATLSATAHQEISPNPYFAQAKAFSERIGALGLCIAHSGTVIGLLFAGGRDPAAVEVEARERLPALERAFATRLIGAPSAEGATAS
ncbi:MAG: GHMP kinase [Chloroflexi bacterium]|nr:GHMP kinase [Chloroflexota bacterium]